MNGDSWLMEQDPFTMDPNDPDDVEYHRVIKEIQKHNHRSILKLMFRKGQISTLNELRAMLDSLERGETTHMSRQGGSRKKKVVRA